MGQERKANRSTSDDSALHENIMEELCRYKRLYETLIANVHDPVLHLSPSLSINFANEALSQYCHSGREELAGRDVYALILDEDRRILADGINSINHHKPTASIEIRLKTANGKILWQQWQIQGIYKQNDELLEYHVLGHNICELYEQNLPRPSSPGMSVFRQLTEALAIIIYVCEGDYFTYVNSVLADTLEYSREELLNMTYWGVCAPEFQELIRERGWARQRGEIVPEDYEVKVITKSGKEVWLNLFSTTTVIEGERIIVVGAHNISARKKAEAELQAAWDEMEMRVEQRTAELSKANEELLVLNRNFRDIVMNMSDGVLIVNKAGKFVMLNPAMKHAWGDSVEEIEANIRAGLLKGKSSYIDRMLNKQQAFRDVEIIFSTVQGNIHCLASGTPIAKEPGVVESGVIIIRPITEVHRLVNRFSGAQAAFRFPDIISSNKEMLGIIQSGYRAAASMSNVLIEGESGTGKELFAQAIHNQSPRQNGPFVAVNCGAIPRQLIGSELFGYAEGAFTGAKKGGNPGKFELASGGTLFLDEIGDMPFEQQVALLRVIQEKKLSRIGSDKVIPVDVRIMCATNKNLAEEMSKGSFRPDLYYRLNVISLKIPPLRERLEDIPLLLKDFLSKSDQCWKSGFKNLDPRIIKKLQQYSWPGNVRELQNVVERILNAANGAEPSPEHLPDEILFGGAASLPVDSLPGEAENCNGRARTQAIVAELERNEITLLLSQYRGNVSKVARALGISRNTVYRKMKLYDIEY